MDYRRHYVYGGTYFFTVVTYHRLPIFSNPDAVEALRSAFRFTKDKHPFEIIAIIILPDHIHTIWKLPETSADFSTRWRLIKSHFTRNWGRKNGYQMIWQNRFWEHTIQNGDDLSRHIDYIHLNPVKHGYSLSPANWSYSSFLKFVKESYYPENWGIEDTPWEGTVNME